MITLTTRRRNVLTGAIAVLLLVGAVTVGIKGAFGAFKGGYVISGSFDAAGQGLLPGSDVKIRGVNVGEVKNIQLVDGRALIRLRINSDTKIPVDATATIRPKTLFGEKFVDIDPGPAGSDGPHLADGDEIVNTLGGFELEQVLADIYPILQSVDATELMTILSELAEAGDGLGETINRSLVNSEKLTTLFADNSDLTRRFLSDLADLSDQLAASADDLLGVADAGNVALPTLNANEEAIVDLLEQAGRLSNDVADLLENNRDFVSASLGDGSRTVQLLFDRRDDVIPLVIGLRQYLQVFSETIRIDAGDGTLLAAVKVVLGGEVCTLISCPGLAAPGTTTAGPSTASVPPPVPGPAPSSGGGGLDDLIDNTIGSVDGSTDNGLLGLLRKVLGA